MPADLFDYPVAGKRERKREGERDDSNERRGQRRESRGGGPPRVCTREKQESALFSVLMLPSITPTTFSRRERARQSVHGFQWLSR